MVILGGTGFLGGALSRGLRTKGVDVVVASHRGDGDVFPWDITEPAASERALERLRPDVVINLAASGVTRGTGTQDLMQAVNAGGPAQLVEAIAQSKAAPRLIHVSSSRELDAGSQAEDHGVYGRSKASGTATVLGAVESDTIEGCVLRLHSVYGPGQPADRFVAWMVRRVRARQPIELHEPHTVLDFVHVDDVADAFLRAVEQHAHIPEIIDVGTGRASTVLETTKIAIRCADADPSLVSCRTDASVASDRPGEPADISAARKYLGWRAETDLTAGLHVLVNAPL